MFPAGVPGIHGRRIVLRDGTALRIAESGEGSGTPTLLLHGWGASLYMWRAWFAPLAAAGRRVVAVDLPGHGLSGKPADPAAYRLDRLVATIREILDHERWASVDIVAQSMAGTIALELGLVESRVRRMALVNPASFGRIALQALGRALSPPLVDLVLPHFVRRADDARAHRLVYGDPSLITERDVDEYWAPSRDPAYARAMRRLLHEFRWDRLPADQTAMRLRGLRREALVVLGTRDRLVRDAGPYAAALRAAGAPLAVREVAGGGHAVNEERPAEVMGLVLPFLDGR